MYSMHKLVLLFCAASFIIPLSELKKCPPIIGHTIHALCTAYLTKEFPCRTYVNPGTKAKLKCAFMYERLHNGSTGDDILKCGNDGNWDKLPFECEQICGTMATNIPLSVNSQITEVYKVPWQIAIYSKNSQGKFQHICGGTLVKSKTIISAAHCFWNSLTSSLHDKSDYVIAAGKYYRDYYAINETENVQISKISLISIPLQFTGAEYDYISDIAVITLDRHILFQNHIRPACLPWSINKHVFTLNNTLGVVAGWGMTNTGTYSPELRSVELISIDGGNCKRKIRKTEKVTNDKFCVETTEGKNVCKGDSGGGFLICENVDGFPHFFLMGIVSNGIAHQKNSAIICNSNFVTTFTNVQIYENLVRQTERCLVPNNGELMLKNTKTNNTLTTGRYVEIFTNVTYVCPKHFSLDGHHTTNFCNGDWVNPHPKCSKMCLPLISIRNSHSRNAVCNFKSEKVPCNQRVEVGTTVNVSCAFMYRRVSGNENMSCKSDGNWDKVPIVCEQICGTNDLIQHVSTQNQETKISKVPWHVGIYLKNSDGKYDYICGGTLIHSKVIVTAASCFWNPEESVLNEKSNYIVTLGKVYRDYYASNETEEVRKLNISKIEASPKFWGAINNYAFDIAIVSLEDPIIYNNNIRPACLGSNEHFNANQSGVVTGWRVTDTGIYMSELRSFDLLSIDHKNCKAKISEDYKTSYEKFCAETKEGKDFCFSDNGSGFLIPEDIDGVTIYHLWGVVSNKIETERNDVVVCNSNSTITFNNIRQHKGNILKAIRLSYFNLEAEHL